MKAWNPFIVKEIELKVPPRNPNTHVVVLRVDHCVDQVILEDNEVNCYNEAHSLNEKIRLSLSDFIEGK